VLNAGHCALGHLGSLAGHTTSDEAMRDPVVRGVVERMLREEVLPLLPPVDGIDPHAYLDATLERFANPAIGDRLARLGRRGTVKMPAYLLPSLHEALEQGRPHALLLLAVAGWLRYLRGDDLRGRPLEVEDPRLDQLRALGAGRSGDPRRVLGVRSVFGNLADRPLTAQRLGDLVRLLDQQGLAAAAAACGADTRALVA
jgi:fructuronate reductase/mannitol 2-dehydrogenase